MAGEDSAAELSAEIVPGNQGRSDCRIVVIMKFTTQYLICWSQDAIEIHSEFEIIGI